MDTAVATDPVPTAADADRQAFASVVEASLAASTRRSYRRVATQFAAYCVAHGLRPTSAEALTDAAMAFLGSRVRAGYASAVGRQLYAALRDRWPEWTPVFRAITRGTKGWERVRPIVKRPPLVRPLATALRLVLVRWGYPAMGVGVFLAHHCFLRVGELLRAEPWHVVPARSVRTGFANRHAYLHLPLTKTGAQQDVEVTDVTVADLVAVAVRVAASRSSESKTLFGVREHAFRRRFADAAAALGLPATIVPHSLRHGGATDDYTSGARSAEEVRVRGRWRAERSLHHYVGSMRSALATLHVPSESVAAGAVLQQHLREAFAKVLDRAPDNAEVLAFRRALKGKP